MPDEKKDTVKEKTPKQLIGDMEKAERDIAALELDLKRARVRLDTVKRLIVKQVIADQVGQVFDAVIDGKIYECSKTANSYNIIPK